MSSPSQPHARGKKGHRRPGALPHLPPCLSPLKSHGPICTAVRIPHRDLRVERLAAIVQILSYAVESAWRRCHLPGEGRADGARASGGVMKEGKDGRLRAQSPGTATGEDPVGAATASNRQRPRRDLRGRASGVRQAMPTAPSYVALSLGICAAAGRGSGCA